MNYSKQEFERLFKDSYPHMYRMAFSMVENADDAKDAVHQVFVQIWKRKPQVADDSIRGYLLAATRNQCLHTLRSRQLQRQMEDELRQDIAASESEDREELLQQLRQVIDDNLTEQDRRVLSLHYDEEMTYQETATLLGISASVSWGRPSPDGVYQVKPALSRSGYGVWRNGAHHHYLHGRQSGLYLQLQSY
jgi:RNA polymerase sigma-70 factor (ECF subfamily)